MDTIATTTDRGIHGTVRTLLLGVFAVLLAAVVVGAPSYVIRDYFEHKTAAAAAVETTKLELQAHRHDIDRTNERLQAEITERKEDRRILRAIAKKLRVDVP